jgi:hypothetical protein
MNVRFLPVLSAVFGLSVTYLLELKVTFILPALSPAAIDMELKEWRKRPNHVVH